MISCRVIKPDKAIALSLQWSPVVCSGLQWSLLALSIVVMVRCRGLISWDQFRAAPFYLCSSRILQQNTITIDLDTWPCQHSAPALFHRNIRVRANILPSRTIPSSTERYQRRIGVRIQTSTGSIPTKQIGRSEETKGQVGSGEGVLPIDDGRTTQEAPICSRYVWRCVWHTWVLNGGSIECFERPVKTPCPCWYKCVVHPPHQTWKMTQSDPDDTFQYRSYPKCTQIGSGNQEFGDCVEELRSDLRRQIFM